MPARMSRWTTPLAGLEVIMRVILAAVLTAVIGQAASSSSTRAPYVLRMEPRGMSFGLLYTPEMLAAVVADKSPDAVPARIADAIRNGDAIVVMWTWSPNPPPAGLSPRPYKIAVVKDNPAMDVTGPAYDPWNVPDRIEPKWIVQDAADLAQLDPRLERRDVAAMAAFPRAVFVPGRRLYLWLGPEQRPDLHFVAQTRWAMIEWNGNQPVARRH
jgi:hypothetical protein